MLADSQARQKSLNYRIQSLQRGRLLSRATFCVSCCSKMRLYDRQQTITRVPVVVKLPVNDRFGQAPRREETSTRSHWKVSHNGNVC